MEKQHLHLLIHEEIYRIGGDEVAEISSEESPEVDEAVNTENVKSTSVEETEVTSQVAETESQPITKPTETETPEIPKPKQETPLVPEIQEEEPKEIPLAIFHSSTNPGEMDLLQKIIDACKVPTSDYVIFENGFDQTVNFKKALVFVPSAKAFYTPIPYKKSHFLCSKPLSDLANDQQEKGKLWVALQQFVLQ